MDKLQVVDSSTVCAVLSISDRTLRTWVSDLGCPSNKEGRSVTFNWPDVLAWYVDYAAAKKGGVSGDFAPDADDAEDAEPKENLAQAMLRKTTAEADIKTLALSKLRGETINISDAKLRVDRTFGNLRTALLGMPPKLGTRLAGVKDPAEIEAVCKEEMEALCRELSSGQIVGIQEQSEAEGETVDELQASAEEIFTEDMMDRMADDLVQTYTILATAEEHYAALGD
ncbi:MAG TPA: hypothetical protein VIM67_07190 [Terriglobus sp.]